MSKQEGGSEGRRHTRRTPQVVPEAPAAARFLGALGGGRSAAPQHHLDASDSDGFDAMEGGPGGTEDEYVVMATRATTTVRRRAAAAAASSGLGATAEEGSGEVGAVEVEGDVPGGTGEGLEGFTAGLGGEEGEEVLLPQQAWQPGAEYPDLDLPEEAARHAHAEWPGPPQSRPSGLVNFPVLGPLALLLFALSASSMLAYLPSALPQLGAMHISAPQGPPHRFNATAVEAQHQLLATMENSIARVQEELGGIRQQLDAAAMSHLDTHRRFSRQVEQLELQLKMSEEAILEKMSAMLGGKSPEDFASSEAEVRGTVEELKQAVETMQQAASRVAAAPPLGGHAHGHAPRNGPGLGLDLGHLHMPHMPHMPHIAAGPGGGHVPPAGGDGGAGQPLTVPPPPCSMGELEAAFGPAAAVQVVSHSPMQGEFSAHMVAYRALAKLFSGASRHPGQGRVNPAARQLAVGPPMPGSVAASPAAAPLLHALSQLGFGPGRQPPGCARFMGPPATLDVTVAHPADEEHPPTLVNVSAVTLVSSPPSDGQRPRRLRLWYSALKAPASPAAGHPGSASEGAKVGALAQLRWDVAADIDFDHPSATHDDDTDGGPRYCRTFVLQKPVQVPAGAGGIVLEVLSVVHPPTAGDSTSASVKDRDAPHRPAASQVADAFRSAAAMVTGAVSTHHPVVCMPAVILHMGQRGG